MCIRDEFDELLAEARAVAIKGMVRSLQRTEATMMSDYNRVIAQSACAERVKKLHNARRREAYVAPYAYLDEAHLRVCLHRPLELYREENTRWKTSGASIFMAVSL